ncbi:hypothetical protein V6N12_050198 [Hibiscus sabdariffa]|uniref:Uncharacterized protein n=1 Tax=Hibiscus sabdariffa TaxID=183260 RepID=A0ABR2GBR2_9ROSI
MRWKDPYGSSLSTVRQKAYVEALRLDTMFTPQIVVQGRAQCVANEEDTLLSTIINAPRFPAPSFQLSEELLSAREEARVAREKLAYSESEEKNNALWLLILYGDCDFAIELSKEVEDLISEAQESKEVAQKLSFLVDKAFQIKKFVDSNAGNIHEELGEDCVLEDIGPQGPSDVPTPISDQGEDFPLSYQREELD